ncbi:MAG: NAD-dependent epimerase [Hyphomicrobiales bacterium]
MSVLVTGVAGFIGNHLAHRLLEAGRSVVGLDNLSPYYDVTLKRARLERLQSFENFTPLVLDLCDAQALGRAFGEHKPEAVLHMAAQPGVRYSLEAPEAYVQSNMVGFANLLEACRHHRPRHLIYASSSSVYGANTSLPSSTHGPADHPLTLYAASKRANELMAHSYSHLFAIPATGLRFFTVYGEWGRPDMAFFKFTDAILNDRPIQVYNEGRMSRDFTYVKDVAEAVVRLIDHVPSPDAGWQPQAPDPASSGVAPHRVYNVGNATPVALMTYIELLQEALGRRALIELAPMQQGEVKDTWADTRDLSELIGYTPQTPVETGIARFVVWYKDYYGIS